MMKPVARIYLYLFNCTASKIHAGISTVIEIYSRKFIRKTEQ